MIPLPVITDDILSAFVACRYKGYLKLTGETGDLSEYQRLQDRLDADYRAEALARPPAHRGRPRKNAQRTDATWPPKVGVRLTAEGESCQPDGLELTAGGHEPILCIRHNLPTRTDRVRLGFQAGVLGRAEGRDPIAGTIIHGPKYARMRIRLARAIEAARARVTELAAMASAPEPPRAVLNRHCPDCEFQARCRAAAVQRDDLSLLSGMPDKETARLNKNGVFTVTQYAYTFRPGRLKRTAKQTGRKHDLSLQALSIRDKKIFVVQRPTLPVAKTQVFLDIEGLTDPNRYYLVGLLIVAGDATRHVSFWVDSPDDESALWEGLMKEVGQLGDDYSLFHYGSYDARFLRRMAERHGGEAQLLKRLEEKTINVLSLLHGQVYFPVYVNSLKEVAACLGFKWAAAEPSGRQAIVWRHQWEANGDPSLKAQLIEYNRDDCAALRRVTEALRSIADSAGTVGPDALPVAEAGDLKVPKRHKFGDPDYILPEFNRIVRCSYFDYQRDKILFRTNPAVRKAVRRLRRPAQRWDFNRDVTLPRPESCPQCGSNDLRVRSHHQKRLIDLKSIGGGLKRWVTREQADSYLCRACGHVLLPWPCPPGRHEERGPTICGLTVYATVALRVTTEGAADILGDLFGVRLHRAQVPDQRSIAAERYRGTYEAILAELRSGPVVHADETFVKLKRPSKRGQPIRRAACVTSAWSRLKNGQS